MSATIPSGELWRLPHTDAVTLRRLLAAVLPDQCWSFGGALLWDVRTDIADKRTNLRQILLSSPDTVDVSGDFGHAFAAEVEVRWKRLDDGAYDVLMLMEGVPLAAQAFGLVQIATFPIVVVMAEARAMYLRASEAFGRLEYFEYRAANGAAQFSRYARYSDAPTTNE